MRVVVCLIGLSLAAAQTAAPRPGTVAGRVVNSVSGEGLRKASVALEPERGRGARYTASTDPSGRFQFEAVAPGSYRVQVERAGFVAPRERQPNDRTRLIAVGPGGEVRDVVVKLMPQGVIAGRVLDEDGDPLQYVQVQVLALRHAQGSRQLVPASAPALTNDIGEYRLAGIAPGRYYVLAKPRSREFFGRGGPGLAGWRNTPAAQAEQNYVPVYFPNAMDLAQAHLLEVPPGADLRGIDFQFTKVNVYRIRGRVRGLAPTERTMSGAMLFAYPAGGEVGQAAAGRLPAVPVRADGTFEVGGVRPGTYELHATQFGREAGRSGRIQCVVGEGNVEGVELSLRESFSFSGRIEIAGGADAPVTGIEVMLVAGDGAFGGARAGRVREDGGFSIRNVEAQRYGVHVRNVPEGLFVDSLHYAGQAVPEDQGLDLAGGGASELRVVLAAGAPVIEGNVETEAGEPAAGAVVVAVPEAHPARIWNLIRTATTDQSGAFRIATAAPGSYRIYAWSEVEEDAWQDPDFLKRHESRAARLKLERNSRERVELKVIPRD